MLRSKDILIRPISENDITEDYLNWLNDKEVNKFLESRFSIINIDNLFKYVHQIMSNVDVYFFAICLKESGKHIGNIKLGPINNFHNRAEIGLMIGDKNCWGKGYGKQAIKLITQFAFDSLKLNKVTAGCYSTNVASKKSFLTNDFEIEGTYKNHFLGHDGVWVDLISFSKFNE